jgi:4-amino-4-deoxy-L-arabinose transferase-like glycosyltransferase
MDGFLDNKGLFAERVRKDLTIRVVSFLDAFHRPQSEELKLFWALIVFFFLVTRILPLPEYFSIDNVNLALALERFDPRVHQPQPPGYPFFVAFSKLVNAFVADARTTFAIVSFIVCGLCLPLIFALAYRMFSPWVAKAATLLFVVNPVFWYGGLNGALRPNLALFSLLAAYCAWRAWQGEQRFVAWGALAIGIGSGFRPGILVYMFPLWLTSAWLGTRSLRALVTGMLLLTAGVLAWFSMLVVAIGGLGPLWNLMSGYAVEQSQGESVLFGATIVAWMNQVNRLFIWNGISLLGAAWAIPWFLRSKGRLDFRSPQATFMAVWLLPGLTFQALTHVAAPGHTLFSTPGLCIIAAYVLWIAIPGLVGQSSLLRQGRDTALYGAALLNVLLFANVLPVPTSPSTGSLTQVRNAIAYGIFETSLGHLRWYDLITQESLKHIQTYTPKNQDEPAILISSDVHSKTWFMNWRIARYYLPNRDIWVIADQMEPPMAQLVRREKVIETRTGQTVQIPIPCKGRILWLIENGGPVYTDLSRIWELDGSPFVVVTATQVGSKCPGFRVKNFEFVPQ